MNILNKILLVLITLAGCLFLVLASNRYMLEKGWEAKIAASEKKLAAVESKVATLEKAIYGATKSGDENISWPNLGLIAQRDYVRSLLSTMVFVNCEPKSLSPSSESKAEASFILPAKYDDKGLFKEGLVYVFDSGIPFVAAPAAPAGGAPAGGTPAAPSTRSARFLGMFEIKQVNASRQVVINSVNALTKDEVTRLDRSIKEHNGWFVFTGRLPVDSPDDIAAWLHEETDRFAQLSESDSAYFQKKTASVADVEALGGGTAPADAVSRRIPRDYVYLLEYNYTLRDNFVALIARKETALTDINVAVADQLVSIGNDLSDEIKPLVDMNQYAASKRSSQVPTLSARKTQLQTALTEMSEQRDLVKTRLELTREYLKKMEDRIGTLVTKNTELATAIALAQFQTIKLIKGKTAKSSVPEPSSGQHVKSNATRTALQYRRPDFEI